MTDEVIQTPAKRRVGDGTPGPGRPKGSVNKATASVKQALLEAFEGIGGVTALQAWAAENQTEFFKLWGKLIPAEVKAELTGADGAPLPTSISIAFIQPKVEGS